MLRKYYEPSQVVICRSTYPPRFCSTAPLSPSTLSTSRFKLDCQPALSSQLPIDAMPIRCSRDEEDVCVRQARSKARAHPYSEEATGCGMLPAAPSYSSSLTRHTAKTVVIIIGRHHRKYQLGTISGESRSVLVRELARVFEKVLTLKLALAKRPSDHENIRTPEQTATRRRTTEERA